MPVMQSAPGAYTVLDGRRYLYFAGTGYLGLQGHPAVIRAACEATRQFGIASATSRGGYGDTPPILEVERRAAEWFGQEAAFYYPSGYMGASLFCEALAGAFHLVLVDELSHYAVTDAAKRTGQRLFRFRHRDANHLHKLLVEHLAPGQRPLVMSDGVFAATGHIAPALRYRDVLSQVGGGTLYLDDAHAVGVLGTGGRGTFEFTGLDGLWNRAPLADTAHDSTPRLYCSGTFSKAVGGYGGVVAGTEVLVKHLKQFPLFNGASAPPIPAAAATARALELLQTESKLRTQLTANVLQLKSKLRHLGLPVEDTPTPIVCLQLKTAESMQQLHQALLAQGIAIAYFPTYAGLGPQGALRIAVSAVHTSEMIEQLTVALGTQLRKQGGIL